MGKWKFLAWERKYSEFADSTHVVIINDRGKTKKKKVADVVLTWEQLEKIIEKRGW